eukprot:2013588-Pyramimonas_sp.AAC.1
MIDAEHGGGVVTQRRSTRTWRSSRRQPKPQVKPPPSPDADFESKGVVVWRGVCRLLGEQIAS